MIEVYQIHYDLVFIIGHDSQHVAHTFAAHTQPRDSVFQLRIVYIYIVYYRAIRRIKQTLDFPAARQLITPTSRPRENNNLKVGSPS